jgi:DNA-binding MarR family transcriptional regulator
MLSISPRDVGVEGGMSRSDIALIALVDQVVRLSGRLAIARKMTTRGAGLRPADWLILTSICRSKNHVTVAQIARGLGHSRQGVQRVANELVEQGLASLVDNPQDRRAKFLVATEQGHRMFELAALEARDWAASLSAGIAPETLYGAARVLAEFRERLELHSRKLGAR